MSFSKSALTLKPYACFYILLAQNMRRTCCNMVVSVGPVTRLSTTLLVKPTLPLGIKKRLYANRAGRVQMHFRWLVYRARELLKKLFLKCTHYGVICMVLRLDGFGTPEGRFPRNLSFWKSALTLKPYACFDVLVALGLQRGGSKKLSAKKVWEMLSHWAKMPSRRPRMKPKWRQDGFRWRQDGS